MYIVIEGIDTAGKSTQIQLLKERFPQAIFTCEPGGSQIGKRLRQILLEEEMMMTHKAECLLFLSDRAEHIAQVIEPNLNRLIVSDRSLISGIAYAQDLDFTKMIELNLFATNGILPHLVVLLKLDRHELMRRLSMKHQDRIEQRGIDFLLKIQERMIRASEALQIPLVQIDASNPTQEICEMICSKIR